MPVGGVSGSSGPTEIVIGGVAATTIDVDNAVTMASSVRFTAFPGQEGEAQCGTRRSDCHSDLPNSPSPDTMSSMLVAAWKCRLLMRW